MKPGRMLQLSRSSQRKAERARQESPCGACHGTGEVVFSDDAILDALVRAGYEALRVVGEAVLVCPACGGDGYD